MLATVLGVGLMIGFAMFAAANVNAMATVVDQALPDTSYSEAAKANAAPPDDYLNLTVRKNDQRGRVWSKVRPLTPGDVAWHRVTQSPGDTPLAIGQK
jgi:hypothetical protein